MVMIISDDRSKRHRAWHPDLSERYNEPISFCRRNDVAHDAAFVAGIRNIRDDVPGLICDGDALRSQVIHERWHQFDFERRSCFECGEQSSGLLRMIDHQRLSTSVNATQRSPMIGNMAQQSHSRYVAQDNLCDVSLIERSPRRLDTLSGAACAARTMEPYRK